MRTTRLITDLAARFRRQRASTKATFRILGASGFLALAAVASCGEGHVTVGAQLPGAASVAPATVSGYATCRSPACTDMARACDDLFRAGCGKPILGDTPLATLGSAEYVDQVGLCASMMIGDLAEVGESMDLLAGKAESEGEAESALKTSLLAMEAARCTRRASSCGQMFDCLRGRTLPPGPTVSSDAGVAPDLGPPEQPAAWSKPFLGGGPDLALQPAPWADDAGRATVELIPGVDSFACARCAMDRCQLFAYRCFGAAQDPVECPGGDCCQTYRTCVRDCGGYGAESTPGDFYRCAALCETGRPHAAQQLADLQQCAAVACTGCEKLDRPYGFDPDSGLYSLPLPSTVDAGASLEGGG